MFLVGGFGGPFNPRNDREREGVPAKKSKRERGIREGRPTGNDHVEARVRVWEARVFVQILDRKPAETVIR